MGKRIYLSSPDVTQAEEDALVRAFRSGWIAPLGPEVEAFEAELAKATGRKYCVALSSGTAALHLGLLTMGIGPGDVVITSSMTFAATANAIIYTGAEPVFIDSDASGNMSPQLLVEALEDLRSKSIDVAAIVVVDLFGKMADYESIIAIADRWGLSVFSDAAESFGAMRHGRPAGSYGVAAATSFNGNKIMTTSGGGALVTDDADFAKNVRYLATQARQPVLHYEHTDIGYNYRLSNLLAAVGRAQLERLPSMIARRKEIRDFYCELVSGMRGVEIFDAPSGVPGIATHDNYWLTSVLIDPDEAGFKAQELIDHLAEANIESRPLWKPMHIQPVFASCRSYVNGTSESFFNNGVSLPSGSVLTNADLDVIAARIESLVKDRVYT